MKQLIFFFFCLAAPFTAISQSNIQQPTSINSTGAAPDPSAMLDVQSTTKGVLAPRMTTAQRTAIASPATGLLVFDTNTNSFWFFNGTIWNGIAATMLSFVSGSNNNPFAIPDWNNIGIQSTINFAQPGIIEAGTQIKVCLDITHTSAENLYISLIAPDGTTIDLSSQNGSLYEDNYTNTCFVTGATTSITAGAAPFTGNWMPEQPFSTFLSKNIAGNWNLKVADIPYGDYGTLNSWSLEFSLKSSVPSLLSDKDGNTKIQVEKTPNEDKIHFDVAGTERMVMDNNGSVGIGTANPAAKLEVSNGTVGLQVFPGMLDNNPNNNWVTLDIPSGGNLRVWDNFSVSENVGIGVTTIPANIKLQVQGNVGVATGNSVYVGGVTDSGVDGLRLHHAGSSAYIDHKGSGNIHFRANNVEGGTVRMTIKSNGNIGIGRDPATNILEVEGDASKSSAGDWLANSDARLKKNIRSLDSESMLTKMLSLQGVTYEWNDDKTGSARPEGIQYGFTAQNIQAAFPTLVEEDNLGYLQTAYGTYDAMTVEAIRALNDKIAGQQALIEAQAEALRLLEIQVARLQKITASLETAGAAADR